MLPLKSLASIKCRIKMFVYFLNIICFAGISIVKMPELNSLLPINSSEIVRFANPTPEIYKIVFYSYFSVLAGSVSAALVA